jgi:hypothetical protein
MGKREFTDGFADGIEMSSEKVHTETMEKSYPDYLTVTNRTNPIVLQTRTRIDPTKLTPNCAYTYHDTLYVTDSKGNIAYMDAELRYVKNTGELRDLTAQRKVGGTSALHRSMDAGHVQALNLDGHPDMVQEQHSGLNRYTNKSAAKEDWENGMFRDLERDWTQLAKDGHNLNVKAVFSESRDGSEGTYSPEWCYQVTDKTTGEKYQYNMINEGSPDEATPTNTRKEIKHPPANNHGVRSRESRR